jgi:hypothetical protein
VRVAVLVDPAWKVPARAYAVSAAIAKKHPDAVIVSAGIGPSVYAVERAALEAGLRVAAFRPEGRDPTRGPVSQEGPPLEPVMDVRVHELEPAFASQLWSPNAYPVAWVLGEAAARECAVMWAVKQADEVVVLSEGDWLAHVEAHRFAS